MELDKLLPGFFIVGADRSGTTMLRLMLNSHPEISVGPETWFFLDLLRKFAVNKPLNDNQLDEAINIVLQHRRFGEYPVDTEVFLDRVRQLSQPTIAEIYAILPAVVAEREGKTIVGDKTPGYSSCLGELARAFPEAKFIHIVRDARDVALSIQRVGWYGGRSWRATEHWIERVKQCETARKLLGPQRMMLVLYRDLILNTRQTLAEICKFLNVEYSDSMLYFHKSSGSNILPSETSFHQKTMRPPSPDDVDVWKRKANRRLLLYVEGGAGQMMKNVGQDLSLRGMSRVQARIMWWLVLFRMRFLYPMKKTALSISKLLNFKKQRANAWKQ